MAYDQKIRTYASELSKSRTPEADIVNLQEEGWRIKREVIREFGSKTTFADRNAALKRKKGQNDWKGDGENDWKRRKAH